jgi:hypothetical protein
MPKIAPDPHLDAEEIFDRVVDRAGGVRVDKYINEPIGWENADYYFERDAIVAELKEIVSDPAEDQQLTERISTIYNRYADRGEVPVVYGSVPIEVSRLPLTCQREMLLPFKRRLEKHVKKAARQIKETKARLQKPDLGGLLVLVNEASTFFRPDIALYFLFHILKGQYSSIDHVVYCSINMLLVVPEEPSGARFWVDSPLAGRRDIPIEFTRRLGQTFLEVIDSEIGVPSVIISRKHLEPFPVIERRHAREPDYFVQPKHFYRSPLLGYSYFCDSVDGGTATMYLVESSQNGKLVQAQFCQKLIYANRTQYERITDQSEICRLRKMLKRLKRTRSPKVERK